MIDKISCVLFSQYSNDREFFKYRSQGLQINTKFVFTSIKQKLLFELVLEL